MSVTAYTFEGDQNHIFNEKWWYAIGRPYSSIWVNKFNTIIYLSNRNSESEEIINKVTLEIIGRMKNLSK